MSPALRLLGACSSWSLLALGTVCLVGGLDGLGAVGGACADAGPYVVAVECPRGSGLLPALGALAVAAAVATSLVLARGFGVVLAALAWPVLFGAVGALFLASLRHPGADRVSALVCGAVFLVLGVGALALLLAVGRRRILAGYRDVHGRRVELDAVPRAVRRLALLTAVPPATAGTLLGVLLVTSLAG